MDVMATMKEVITILDRIDEYSNDLVNRLSELDSKEQDILHYIENNKISVIWCYNIIRKIKEIRIERRKVKNDRELLSKYHDIKTKLTSKDNRQFILTELCKKEKQLQTTYKNRQFSDEDIKDILRGITKETKNDTTKQDVQDK